MSFQKKHAQKDFHSESCHPQGSLLSLCREKRFLELFKKGHERVSVFLEETDELHCRMMRSGAEQWCILEDVL